MYLDRNIHYLFCLMCRKLTFFLKLSLFTSNISKNFPNYLFDSFAFTVSLVRRYYLFYYVNVAEEDSVCFSVSAFHKSSEGDLFWLPSSSLYQTWSFFVAWNVCQRLTDLYDSLKNRGASTKFIHLIVVLLF